jgi:hypothetical protein
MSPTELLAAGTLIFFWLLFIVADYSWEKKKRRGLDARAGSGFGGSSSERADYRWYSWIRYLTMILLTYINTLVLETSQDQVEENPSRLLEAISLVIILSIVLLLVDGLWERKRRRVLSGFFSGFFWSYFWLRYPVLIAATIAAARRGLQ